MIRIGLTRWFIIAERVPQNGGRVIYRLSLVPQGREYLVSMVQWKGIHRSINDVVVSPKPVKLDMEVFSYDLVGKPWMEVSTWGRMASEAANYAVAECLRSGLVDFEEFPRMETEYLVSSAIMKVVESGKSDEVVNVERIDLVADMLAMRGDREARRAEARRLAEEAWRAHGEDVARRGLFAKEAVATSMEFLYEYLTEDERKEAKEHGRVTVSIAAGDFVVPVSAHGLVRQYVDGKYKMSYCIVFQDYSIPVGDEALMKIVLLKADPKKFMAVANKFAERYPTGAPPRRARA